VSSINADLLSQSQKYLLQLYARPSLIFTHGIGSHLFDTGGRKYLDLTAGIAVNALGHNDPDVVHAIQDQCKKLIHLSNLYHGEYTASLAKLLIDGFGGRGPFLEGGKVFFGNSGTEANEGKILLFFILFSYVF